MKVYRDLGDPLTKNETITAGHWNPGRGSIPMAHLEVTITNGEVRKSWPSSFGVCT